MKNISKIKMTCILVCVVMCVFVLNREVFSKDIYGILTKNRCIELTSDEHEIIVLNIYRGGLYAIKTSGENDVVLKLVDKDNNEVIPNYKEHDNNYYATYSFVEGKYYADVKVDRVGRDAVTKLWLFLMDESIELVDNQSSFIEIEGEEKYFRYVPCDTDTYMIRSRGKIDVSACIYDERGMILGKSSSLTGSNFKLIGKLEEGKCYYIRVYSENDIGSFSIEAKKEKTCYSDVINLEIDDNLDRCFEGCIKEEYLKRNIEFIPDVDGEFEFLVVSDMELKLDVLDENGGSVATSIDNNKNYSAVRASVNAGHEYTVTISAKEGACGVYKFRVLSFEKLRSGAESIVVGDNESVLGGKEKYFKFRCPKDGCFNFELAASLGTKISLYDENGKFIKEQKNCAYVSRPTVGVNCSKDDLLYVRVSNENETKEDIGIVVTDFGELIKRCIKVTEGEVEGSISEDSPAVLYKFVPQMDGVYTIKSTCKFYIDGRLYNGSGDIISENNEVDMKFRITRRMKEGMTYYIKVTDLYKDSVGDFSLDIELVSKNDVLLLEEDVVVEDEIEYVGDIKRYEFRAGSDDVYAVNVMSDSNMHVLLLSDEGVLIDEEVKHKAIKLSKDKEYAIEVFSQDEMVDVGEYCLEVENFTKKVCNATSVTCDSECYGNLIMSDTKDYYVFSASNSAYYSIYTTGELSTYIKVYDMECALVGEGRVGFDNNAYAVAKFDEGEKYIIEVGGQTNCKTGIYGLKINENKKSLSMSTWLRLNELTTGVVKNKGDVMHYRVVVPSEGIYLFSNYSNKDISVDVYDKSKQVVLQEGSCNFKLEGNSLYYIDISAKDDDVGVYNFKLEDMKCVYDNAKCILDNAMSSGEITKRGQCDYYKFVTYNKDEYIIIQARGEKLVIEVLDRYGNIMSLHSSSNGANRIMLDDKKAYYIRVRYENLLDLGEYEFFIVSKSKIDEYRSQFMV